MRLSKLAWERVPKFGVSLSVVLHVVPWVQSCLLRVSGSVFVDCGCAGVVVVVFWAVYCFRWVDVGVHFRADSERV